MSQEIPGCLSIMDRASFSWERSSQVSSRQYTPSGEQLFSGRPTRSDQGLFVFGYSCKLYRDDDKSQWINFGRHLIPWMGDSNLMIDRYDARGYLNDLSDCSSLSSKLFLSNDEQEFENMLNLERFADLKTADCDDIEKHAFTDTSSKREYSCVNYSYVDENDNSKTQHITSNEDTCEDGLFRCSPSLKVPDGITLPESKNLHCIIEKTAMFVANQGQQMEIWIKTKQASNSNFSFLSIESELYPYYKFLLNEARKKLEKEDSDSDCDYLHPSLLASNKVECKIENEMNLTDVFASKQENSYSQLVKQFKDKFAEEVKTTDCVTSEQSQATSCDTPKLIIEPPADVELIITKMAQHVAKKGDIFENEVKSLSDAKFDFLNKGNIYNPYYVKQKIHYVCERNKQTLKTHSSKPIAFSLNVCKNDKNKKDMTNNETVKINLQEGISSSNVANKDCPQDSFDKKLQAQRKKKVLEFVKLLKKQKSLNSSVQTFGPNLPPNDPELSPTIEAVTSPIHLNLDDSDLEPDFVLKNTEEKDDSPKPSDLLGSLIDKLPKSSKPSSPVRHREARYSPPRRYRSCSEDSTSPRRSSLHKKRSRKSSRSHSRSRSKSRSHKSHRSRHKKRKSTRHRRHSHSSRSSSSRSPSHSRSRHRSKSKKTKYH